MKQKPDLIMYLLVGVMTWIIASWIYLAVTKNMDHFKPKPDEPMVIHQNVSITIIEHKGK